jgi:GT2 family glycosyltransferase
VRSDINLGFGGANELGAAHARSDVLCFMNPDVIVPQRWLAALLDLVDQHPRAVIAPELVNPDGTVQEAGSRIDASGFTRPTLPGEAITRVDYASAACWLVRRDVHEAIGGFDARFHPAYYEDVDYVLRLRRAGGTCIIADGVSVTHERGGSTDQRVGSTDPQRATLTDLWRGWLWQQPRLDQADSN